MVSSKLLEKYKFTEEQFELTRGKKYKTGFPQPAKHLRLIWESSTMSIEEAYHWILTSLRFDGGFQNVVKITDIFAASQASSFFGHAQARLGINQDRASNLFAQIGKMVKDVFQIVRELRTIDEKLDYYEQGEKGVQKGENPAEIALKGVWVDQVEGGAKNATSVIGLSRDVGFAILPDLFFSIHPMTQDQIKPMVDKLQGSINRKVRELLSRKLFAYVTWRHKTKAELKQRFNFQKKFLKQHYEIIQMYMSWVKPYLKYTQTLAMNPETMDRPDLVSAFEGSLLEIEILCHQAKNATNFDNHKRYAVASVEYVYRTSPTMPYHQDEYRHKGPLHVGKVEINFRAYSWSQEQLDNYLAMKKEEDFELLKTINSSIQSAMDSLGDDLKKYLLEKGEYKEEDKKEKETPATPLKKRILDGIEPVLLPFKGMGELIGAFFPGTKGTPGAKLPPKLDRTMIKKNESDAQKTATKGIWNTYKNFKKAHGMIAW